jgi:hypothetical protein
LSINNNLTETGLMYAQKGDLKNEDSVLEWLLDDENRELANEISRPSTWRMLERLLDESPFLAVFFICKYFACRLTLVAI